MSEGIVGAAMLACFLAACALVGIASYQQGVNAVLNTCRAYNQYYIEPRTDKDPLGYYLNCNVTTGPEIAKKK